MYPKEWMLLTYSVTYYIQKCFSSNPCSHAIYHLLHPKNRSISNNKGGPKVYDVTSYLDDHPGGSEVLLDVAGQDADEFFEDIGHSNDARDELKKHLVGTLKLSAEDIEKRKLAAEKKSGGGGGGGMGVIAVVVAVVAAGYFYYKNNMAEGA